MSKTFENASRADAQSIDPLRLCIIGGKALPEEERGPLDTDWDPNHPQHAHDLLHPLDPLDVESVYEHGVIVPIEVVRMKDVPVVVWGRGRVRKARVANPRRKKAGLPLIEIKFCVVRITNGLQLLRRATAENLRRKTFGVLDRIELAKQLMLHGATEHQAAEELGVSRARFKDWLSIEDHASPALQEALRQDRLGPSAAIVLSEIRDHALQDQKLAEFLRAPQPTARAARRLVRGQSADAPTRPRLPEQKQLLTRVDEIAKGNDWMQGARAALRWVTGEGAHRDLEKLLTEDQEGPKKKNVEP